MEMAQSPINLMAWEGHFPLLEWGNISKRATVTKAWRQILLIMRETQWVSALQRHLRPRQAWWVRPGVRSGGARPRQGRRARSRWDPTVVGSPRIYHSGREFLGALVVLRARRNSGIRRAARRLAWTPPPILRPATSLASGTVFPCDPSLLNKIMLFTEIYILTAFILVLLMYCHPIHVYTIYIPPKTIIMS